MALTKRAIDALRYDPAGAPTQILWDGTLSGFGVRVFSSGAKSFIIDYRANGRKRRLTIGTYGVLTPKQARDLAVQELAKVAKGGDPAEERRTKRDEITLREFADVYITRHAKPRNRTWAADRRRLDKNILPKLGSRKLGNITRADIARLHSRMGQHAPAEANRHTALLSSMRSRAIEWGYLPETAPSWNVKKYAERKRDRWAQPDELPALLTAIDAEESIYVRTALHLALLTGMRRGEILGLRWQDVNLERAEIHLPQTKADRPHTVPLVPEAAAMLAALPRMLGNLFVFPSPTRQRQPMHDLKGPWHRVRGRIWLATHPDEAVALRAQAEADVAKRSKHAGAHEGRDAVRDRLLLLAAAAAADSGDALRMHDLRRTTGSLMAISGNSLVEIGSVLNHSNPSTTAIYARLIDDSRRNALENVAGYLRAAKERA